MLVTQVKPGPTAAFMFLAALGPLSLELSLPWLPRMGAALGADATGLQFTLSAWLLGFALAHTLSRPLGASHGARTMLIGGLALYAATTFGCLLAPTVDLFTFARLGQGFGGGAALAAAATLYGENDRTSRGIARLAAIVGLVAMLAPLAGGFLATVVGWRFGFGLMLLFAGAAFLVVGTALPDTRAAPEDDPGLWRDLWRSDAFVALMVNGCLSFAGVFAFVSASSFVFQEGYEQSTAAAGASFALAVFGFVAGAVVGGVVTGRLGLDRMLRVGSAAQAIGGLGVLGGILFGPGNVAEIVAPMALYLFGAGIVLPQAAAGVCHLFPKRTGEALSVLVICQTGVAAVLGAMVGYMLGTSALPLGMGVASMGVLSAIVHSATRDARREPTETRDEVVADFSGF